MVEMRGEAIDECAAGYNTYMRRNVTEPDYGIAPPGYRLPAQTRVGRVRLQVSDLSRSVAYYRDVLGFNVVQHNGTGARLAVADNNEYLIELHYEKGTRAIPRGGLLGLYHFAILLPSRASLGQFVRHLARRRMQFGAADHLVSEALYLWDPDGLGIEVYADRPRDTWQSDGRELMMATERLDLERLVESAVNSPDWTTMPAGTTMGHVHLSVGDLEQSSRFFHGALGLDKVVWSYPGALFMSAGGYHHHLGTNTWAMGARVATAGDARMLDWELVLPDQTDITATENSMRAAGYSARAGVVVDPWGTPLRLSVERAALIG
jgi:catechol 2,3-dioxygenase